MTHLRRSVALCTLGVLFLTHSVDGQAPARYRNFELGMNVGAVSALTGVDATEVKTIHERPAVLQDLEWRLAQWLAGSSAVSTDPVVQIVFSFVNDHLFRVVVDYDPDKTEGMTAADMVEALSTVYGASLKRTPGPARVASRVEAESGSPLARWGDASYTAVMYRTASYRGGFRLILTDSALDTIARKAALQAVRLDEQEAPRREVARLKKEKADTHTAAEKARIANKKVFRP
jgi:hypothetical protein